MMEMIIMTITSFYKHYICDFMLSKHIVTSGCEGESWYCCSASDVAVSPFDSAKQQNKREIRKNEGIKKIN